MTITRFIIDRISVFPAFPALSLFLNEGLWWIPNNYYNTFNY